MCQIKENLKTKADLTNDKILIKAIRIKLETQRKNGAKLKRTEQNQIQYFQMKRPGGRHL